MGYPQHVFPRKTSADPEQFFSNVERLRIRLAQSDPSSPVYSTHPNHQKHHHYHARTYRPSARRGSGPLHHQYYYPHSHSHPYSHSHSHSHSRTLRNTSTSSLAKRRGLEKRPTATPRKLRKPGSLQLAYLAAQADSQCFHSLPAKIQQKLFSPEERLRLRHAYRDTIILDAADEAFYRRPYSRRRTSTDSLPSETTLPVAQPNTVFYDSDSEYESDDSMDQSMYDSFRWLDEDGDLDLSLDEYHAHVADAASKSKSRRRPSFRRSLSFSTHALRQHRASPSMPTRPLPASHTVPALSPLASNQRPSSRPGSRRHQTIQHAPKSSTSSIDPAAQYYQDPDARLKLRVYLASPQKFDEAIEFGFPSLEQDKENVAPEPTPSSPNSPTVTSDWAGTFFEDDDGTMVGTPGGSIEEPSTPRVVSPHLKETPRPSVDAPSLLQRRQSFLPGSKTGPQRLPGNREMTLRMTLTRPDLRTESPTPSQTSPQEDPLRLAALPPADRTQMIWDSDEDDKGVVKKMWRRLRRRV